MDLYHYYFRLQYVRLTRLLNESGVPPFVGLVLMAALFVALSKLLFLKLSLAVYFYAGAAIFFIFRLNDAERLKKLRSFFLKSDLHKVRAVENILIALPFCLYLVYERQPIVALGILLSSGLLALLKSRHINSSTLPTPAKRNPFEFPIGFRKSFPIYGLLYFMIVKGYQVDNPNLSVVSFGFLFLVIMSYYLQPEPKSYVWIYNKEPKAFLWSKIFGAFKSSLLLLVPAALFIGLVFPVTIPLLAMVYVMGLLVLVFTILIKYSAFPAEIGLPQAILLAICVLTPPAILLVGPVFYVKAKQQLKLILP